MTTIIATVVYKRKVEEIKTDPDTGAPILDKDGNAIIEEKEVQSARFKVVSVFDVSQTDGKPLPQLADELKGDVKHFDEFVEALKRSAPVPIEREENPKSIMSKLKTPAVRQEKPKAPSKSAEMEI